MLFKKTIFFVYLSTFFVIIILLSLLLKRLSEIQHALKDISKEANQITNTSITQEIPFNSSIDVDQPMDVVKNLSARVLFNLKKSISINDSIKFTKTINVPVNLVIDTTISLSKRDLFIDKEGTKIGIFNSSIPVDTNITININGLRKIKVPIKTVIPLDSIFLSANLNDDFSVSGKIPVKIEVNKVIPVVIDEWVQIRDLKVDVDFPIDELVSIRLIEPIQIKTKIPVNKKVPVDIKVSETGLSKPLKTISLKLDKLGNLIFPFE
jgi:hypothetical protein